MVQDLDQQQPLSSTPRIMYLVLHGIWTALHFYTSFTSFSAYRHLSAPDYKDPFLSGKFLQAAILRNQQIFHSGTFLSIGAFVSLVLILKKRKQGWWMALVTLIVGLLIQSLLLFQELSQSNAVGGFYSIIENPFHPYNLMSLAYWGISLGKVYIVPGLMIWLMWHLAKRGVFQTNG